MQCDEMSSIKLFFQFHLFTNLNALKKGYPHVDCEKVKNQTIGNVTKFRWNLRDATSYLIKIFKENQLILHQRINTSSLEVLGLEFNTK